MMKEYTELIKARYNLKPNVSLEIGSREGNNSAELASLLGIDQTFCIEPHPQGFSDLRRIHPGFHALKCAVTPSSMTHAKWSTY